MTRPLETEQPLSNHYCYCFSIDKNFNNFFSLVAETDGGMILGSGGLGRPGHPASKVGLSAAEELIDSCSRHVCLDRWAQDQV